MPTPREAVLAALDGGGRATFHEVRDRTCAYRPGTSDSTIRKALAALADEGKIKSRWEYPRHAARRLVYCRSTPCPPSTPRPDAGS